MIRLKLFVGFLLSLFSLIFTSIAFAGGGGVYANVLNSEDSHYNTVRVYFDPALFDCKGMVVSFNFESPVDGDRISGSNGDNSSTISDNATYENVNGHQYLRCSTYAKVYSPKLEINRHLNISFKGNNLEGSRTIAVSFGSKSYGENLSLLPWESSSETIAVGAPTCTSGNCAEGTIAQVRDPKIELRLLRQVAEGNNRKVVIKWGGFEGNPFTSKIYGRVSSNKQNWELLHDNQRGPSAEINIPNEDYYVKVNGCMDKVGTCVDSNIMFIGKTSVYMEKTNSKTEKYTPSSTASPLPETIIADNSEELNQKIASLEAELQQSKKEQSALEQRFNYLVNFLKSIFPFFK